MSSVFIVRGADKDKKGGGGVAGFDGLNLAVCRHTRTKAHAHVFDQFKTQSARVQEMGFIYLTGRDDIAAFVTGGALPN